MATATAKTSLKKPVFVKVNELQPGTTGHTLVVKVVSSNMVLQRARPNGTQVRQIRIAECVVGDDTGIITFTARNEQGKFRWNREYSFLCRVLHSAIDKMVEITHWSGSVSNAVLRGSFYSFK